ncbi:hypothetical protein QV09_05605 [Gallibacterium salpingitidis]|uniref:DUF2612 domain-containing protein n=1 Tax=Gallibacterium salpingitidis TaxID=505341 RepID=A0AB36E2M1_9PAST|nr:DUF2612 domain-containing protein [Gallibacterium salpingitidis]OBX10422.1 hypothetical protein QV09_05605 [Gallibacterium salpingitidis]WKT00545.1 DUF2612 domain-containing protein [Gallibacterium salpingitidis]
MIDVDKTIISQYANSPIICNFIESLNTCIDPSKNIDDFYNLIWNLNTAKGIGLDIWGNIVGINRYILINEKNQFLGSSLSDKDLEDFKLNTNYRMNDEMFRSMIFMKAYSNIIYCTAHHINQLLSNLFKKRGRAYFVKNGTMKARYVFEFNLLPVEKAVLISTDLLPRPTGVLIDYYEPDITKTFGFIEAGLAPFGEGAFYIGDA